jgi:hypothetical protein
MKENGYITYILAIKGKKQYIYAVNVLYLLIGCVVNVIQLAIKMMRFVLGMMIIVIVNRV